MSPSCSTMAPLIPTPARPLASAGGWRFCFTAAINVFAVALEECGFCPVINRLSLTMRDCPVGRLREDSAKFQHLIFGEKRHHLGEVDPASAPLAKPVDMSGILVRSTAGTSMAPFSPTTISWRPAKIPAGPTGLQALPYKRDAALELPASQTHRVSIQENDVIAPRYETSVHNV